jgi:hypothetical protein
MNGRERRRDTGSDPGRQRRGLEECRLARCRWRAGRYSGRIPERRREQRDRSADLDQTRIRLAACSAPRRRQETAASGGEGAAPGAASGPQRQASDQDQEGSPPRDRVILVTSRDSEGFSTADVLALYRLRWRIALGFKRLTSVIGLKGPPGPDQRSARPSILAHLLIILFLEPRIDELVDELEDCPRSDLDPARGLASLAPARRHVYSSDHPATDARLPRAKESHAPTPSPRAAPTTRRPKNAPLILAPMRLDPGVAP